MRFKLRSYLFAVIMVYGITAANTLLAEDSKDLNSKATDAVTEILFDADIDDLASYKINDKGFLDITFANNTPDLLYSLMLNKFLHHPDIKGVLAGRGGPACSRFK